MEQNNFTLSEQKIYEKMMESIQSKRKETVSSIARAVNVAPSSVIKLTKKLGYPGWNEMFYTLSNQHADVISLSFNHFDFLANQEMNQYIQILCELLLKTYNGRVYISTLGNADFAGDYLSDKLWERGFTVVPYGKVIQDTEGQRKTPGVIFIINESGVALLSSCMEARKNDLSVVSITSNSQSPLSMHSHVSIELKNQRSTLLEYSPNFFTARVVIFIEFLFVAYDELASRIKSES